ncbi:hypothetical protein ACFWY9_18790 [Amycolatopsis sp. NPDC059027]|uniref:hypothetical protein n=1 Tax=unclassified Amycolatopsis TaxID=2618356 RepID=UPI00366D626C
MVDKWRGVVNGICESILPRESLDGVTAARIARVLVREPLGYLTVEDEFAALEAAIRPGTDLTEVTPPPHGAAAMRAFLAAILNEMEARRPWPAPAVRRVPPSQWRSFPDIPVARVGLPYAYVGMQAGAVFWSLGEDDPRKVLILRLASGAELAFVAPWWDGSDDVAVLLRGSENAREAVAELFRVTSLEPTFVTMLR